MFNQHLVGHRHGVQFYGGLSSLPSAWQREGTTTPAWRHNSASTWDSRIIKVIDHEDGSRVACETLDGIFHMVKSAERTGTTVLTRLVSICG